MPDLIDVIGSLSRKHPRFVTANSIAGTLYKNKEHCVRVQRLLESMGITEVELLSADNTSALVLKIPDQPLVVRIDSAAENAAGNELTHEDLAAGMMFMEQKVSFPEGTPLPRLIDAKTCSDYRVEVRPFVKPLDEALQDGSITLENTDTQLESILTHLLQHGVYAWDFKQDGFGVDEEGKILILDIGSFAQTGHKYSLDSDEYQSELADIKTNLEILIRRAREALERAAPSWREKEDGRTGKGEREPGV